MTTKHRYAYLDGLRGFAAIFILTRHTPFDLPSFYRSYLAVDLFFDLSGFVIAYAYDAKLSDASLTTKQFMTLRLLRLYPVFFISVVLSAGIFFGEAFLKHTVSHEFLVEMICTTFATLLFLPFPLSGEDNLFPLNGAYWSLFFELIANALYAKFRHWLSDRTITLIIILSWFGCAWIAIYNKNFDIGYHWSAAHFFAGLIRSILGITVGFFLYRHNTLLSRLTKTVSPWIIFPVVGLILAAPQQGHFDGLIDLICVCLVFPLCVLIGSNNRETRFSNFLLLLGSASYPLYVLHAPLGQYVVHIWHGYARYTPYTGILFVFLLIFGSVFLEKYYDIPMRRRALKIIKSLTGLNVPRPAVLTVSRAEDTRIT